MIRQTFRNQAKTPKRETDDFEFRERGEEVSRLEGFSDAVFGFAATLLAISVEVPSTFSDLLRRLSLPNLGAFAICFAFLVLIWYQHFRYFRRYGLNDGVIVILNALYLIIVTAYIFPLKFLFSWMLYGFPITPESADLATFAKDFPVIYESQVVTLMVAYSLGYALFSGVVALMHYYAYTRRDELKLTRLEVHQTITSVLAGLGNVGLGLLSIAIAVIGGAQLSGIAGLLYVTVAPLRIVIERWRGNAFRALQAQVHSAG
jgi:uncharacterized membrane protein